MLSWLDSKCIALQTRARRFVENFNSDERGVSAIVATILLIVIVVALAALFWTYISEWFTTMWESITSDASTIGK